MSGTRRAVLRGGTALLAGAVASACGAGGDPAPARPVVAHQDGIVTRPPAAAVVVALDLRVTDRAGLTGVFGALGRSTVESTVAVGASLFDGRFGLADRRPRALTSMPAFPNDVLDPAQCHGDLLVQLGADDPATARAAVADLLSALGSTVTVRWRVEGYRHDTAVAANGRTTDRNLFGFREGVGNPDPRDAAEMDRVVWVQPDSGEPAWAVGGTYQVVRVIRFATALWDAEPLARQEAVFGRRRSDGAPLGRDREDAPFDYANDPSGRLIPLDAHIRRANPRTPETAGQRILRRGYSFGRGVDAAGHRDEGLLFICFQQDLERGFAPIQHRLAGEALAKYLLPVGGGYFFAPPANSLPL